MSNLPVPYYEQDGITIYHGDCRDIPPRITVPVALLLTDPPYSSGGMFRGDKAKTTGAKYAYSALTHTQDDFTGDNRDQRGFLAWATMWLTEAHRVSNPGALLMTFIDWRQLPTMTDAVQAGGWIWRGILPWHKTNARRFAGRFTNACEYVVWASKGPLPNPMAGGGKQYPGIYAARTPVDRLHQTQKPLSVVEGLLAPVAPAGTVLDPFMGSGTTGVAALNTGRRFIGIEVSEHFYGIAAERIAKADREQLALEIDGGAA